MRARTALTGGVEVNQDQRFALTSVMDAIEIGDLKEVKQFCVKSKLPMLQDRGAKSTLDQPQWEEACGMLIQAKQAFEKLLKEAQRLHQSVGDNKNDPLWTLLLIPYFRQAHFLSRNNQFSSQPLF